MELFSTENRAIPDLVKFYSSSWSLQIFSTTNWRVGELVFLVAKATLELAGHGQFMSKSVITVCLNMTSSSLDASVSKCSHWIKKLKS